MLLEGKRREGPRSSATKYLRVIHYHHYDIESTAQSTVLQNGYQTLTGLPGAARPFAKSFALRLNLRPISTIGTIKNIMWGGSGLCLTLRSNMLRPNMRFAFGKTPRAQRAALRAAGQATSGKAGLTMRTSVV